MNSLTLPMEIYQQIIAGHVAYPRHFDRFAKKMIKSLLLADLTKRLGCMKCAADDVKRHKWFQGIDWQLLFERKLIAAIIPRISSTTDMSNFDPYPDSTEEAAAPVFTGPDPFLDF